MDGDRNLVKYFIARTDERLTQMEEKIDQILKFKWQIIGGSLVASIVITALFNIVLAVIERH